MAETEEWPRRLLTDEDKIKLLSLETEFYRSCSVIRQNADELHKLRSCFVEELLDLEVRKRIKREKQFTERIEELQVISLEQQEELNTLKTRLKAFSQPLEGSELGQVHGDNAEQLPLPDTTTITSYSPVESEGATTSQEQPRISEKPALGEPAAAHDKSVTNSDQDEDVTRNGRTSELSLPAGQDDQVGHTSETGSNTEEPVREGTTRLRKAHRKNKMATKRVAASNVKAVEPPAEKTEEITVNEGLLSDDDYSDAGSGAEDIETLDYKSEKRSRAMILPSSDDESPPKIKRVKQISNRDPDMRQPAITKESRAREVSPSGSEHEQVDVGEPGDASEDTSTDEDEPFTVVKSSPAKSKRNGSSSSRKGQGARGKPRRKRKTIIPRGLRKKPTDTYTHKPTSKSAATSRQTDNKKKKGKSRPLHASHKSTHTHNVKPEVSRREKGKPKAKVVRRLPGGHERLSPEIPLQNSLMSDSFLNDIGAITNEEETSAKIWRERVRQASAEEASLSVRQKHQDKKNEESNSSTGDQFSGDDILAAVNRSSPQVLYDCVASLSGSPKVRRRSWNNSPEKRLLLITRKNRLNFRGAEDKKKIASDHHITQPLAVVLRSLESPRKDILRLKKSLNELPKMVPTNESEEADISGQLTAASVVGGSEHAEVDHASDGQGEEERNMDNGGSQFDSRSDLNGRLGQEEGGEWGGEHRPIQDRSPSPSDVKMAAVTSDGEREDGSELKRNVAEDISEGSGDFLGGVQTVKPSHVPDNDVEKKRVDRRKEKHRVRSKPSKRKLNLEGGSEERDVGGTRKDVLDSDEDGIITQGEQRGAENAIARKRVKGRRRRVNIDETDAEDMQDLEPLSSALMAVNAHPEREEANREKKITKKRKRVTCKVGHISKPKTKPVETECHEERERIEENESEVVDVDSDSAKAGRKRDRVKNPKPSKRKMIERDEEEEGERDEDVDVVSDTAKPARKRGRPKLTTKSKKKLPTKMVVEEERESDTVDVTSHEDTAQDNPIASQAVLAESEQGGESDGAGEQFTVSHVTKAGKKNARSKRGPKSKAPPTVDDGEEERAEGGVVTDDRQKVEKKHKTKSKPSKRRIAEAVDEEGGDMTDEGEDVCDEVLMKGASEETGAGRKKAKANGGKNKKSSKRNRTDKADEGDDYGHDDEGGGGEKKKKKAKNQSKTTKSKAAIPDDDDRQDLEIEASEIDHLSTHVPGGSISDILLSTNSQSDSDDSSTVSSNKQKQNKGFTTTQSLTSNHTSRQSHDQGPGENVIGREDSASTDATVDYSTTSLLSREGRMAANRSKRSAASIRIEQDSQLPPPKKRKTLLNKTKRSSEFQLSVMDDEANFKPRRRTAVRMNLRGVMTAPKLRNTDIPP